MVHVGGELNIAPRELNELPLTTFSEKYGEVGLRMRLQEQLGNVGISGCDYMFVARSTELGLTIHTASKPRTYEPYAHHVLRVPLRVIEQLGVTDPEVIAGALLHDTVEMHPREVHSLIEGKDSHEEEEDRARELALTALMSYTNGTVANYVSDVTAPLRQPGDNRISVYRNYTSTLFKEGLPGSRAIKTADFIDNSVPPSRGEAVAKRQGLDAKQLPVYQYHLDGLLHPDSLVPDARRENVRRLLQQAQKAAIVRLRQERK